MEKAISISAIGTPSVSVLVGLLFGFTATLIFVAAATGAGVLAVTAPAIIRKIRKEGK